MPAIETFVRIYFSEVFDSLSLKLIEKEFWYLMQKKKLGKKEVIVCKNLYVVVVAFVVILRFTTRDKSTPLILVVMGTDAVVFPFSCFSR